jgi:hypothetical protein
VSVKSTHVDARGLLRTVVHDRALS